MDVVKIRAFICLIPMEGEVQTNDIEDQMLWRE
jgi:hypothetical protein